MRHGFSVVVVLKIVVNKKLFFYLRNESLKMCFLMKL